MCTTLSGRGRLAPEYVEAVLASMKRCVTSQLTLTKLDSHGSAVAVESPGIDEGAAFTVLLPPTNMSIIEPDSRGQARLDLESDMRCNSSNQNAILCSREISAPTSLFQ